jgi:hypothetical protein
MRLSKGQEPLPPQSSLVNLSDEEPCPSEKEIILTKTSVHVFLQDEPLTEVQPTVGKPQLKVEVKIIK